MKIRPFLMSPNGDSCRLIAALRTLLGAIPERNAVRDAVLLAQRGHEMLLERRNGAFRAVIIDRREERDDLRVLARVGQRMIFGK